jgi:glycosyltransferase involved in cell wall biosynthesis
MENGGAKVLALELIRYFGRLHPDCEFILLTSDRSHEELAILDASNVRRLCISRQESYPTPATPPLVARVRFRLQGWLTRFLPSPLLARVKAVYRSRRHVRRGAPGRLGKIRPDLLFCPFTMPFYHDPAVPTVSIVYDLQHRYYPQYFSAEDRSLREFHFRETCRLADRLVCISDYVRGTVLENSNREPDHVLTIPIRLSGRLRKPGRETIGRVLRMHGLAENQFLLYPANFWLHKNHAMLLTAVGMYHKKYPESSLQLICSGSPDQRMEILRDAARRMGLENRIRFPGFLSDDEFASLLTSCKALIFPSLYEGFGMPVLEAMAFGKPVLCSRVASLPEVAGDAALFFDPRKPTEVLGAIERIFPDQQLTSDLVSKGLRRVQGFGDGKEMAEEYWEVFRTAAAQREKLQI